MHDDDDDDSDVKQKSLKWKEGSILLNMPSYDFQKTTYALTHIAYAQFTEIHVYENNSVWFNSILCFIVWLFFMCFTNLTKQNCLPR